MGTIFVGGHLLGSFAGAPSGLQDFGHLFLLYSDDEVIGDEDLVIRGGPSAGGASGWGSIKLEVNYTYNISADNPSVWAADNGDVENPNQYWGYTALNLDGYPDASYVWETLVKVAEQINTYVIDYDLLWQNSNSTVSTLLSVLGLGVPVIVAQNGDSYTYPADNHKLYFDWASRELYNYEIKGSDDADDILHALDGSEDQGGEQGVTFVGYAGDSIWGYGGRDTIYGGTQNNVLVGAKISEDLDPRNLDFQTFSTNAHGELDDGARDVLFGGEGEDIYLLGGGVDILNNVLTESQIQQVLQLDLIDGADENFIAYAQLITDEDSDTNIFSAMLTDDDLANASTFGDYVSFDNASNGYYSVNYDFSVGGTLLGTRVFDAESGEALLMVLSMISSHDIPWLFGIKNYVAFDPTGTDPWTILGGDDGTAAPLATSVPNGAALLLAADGDQITAGNGDDSIYARGGNDVVNLGRYGGGDDRVDGGEGSDTVDYSDVTVDVTVSLEDSVSASGVRVGVATGSGIGTDTLYSIENVIAGSGNDTIQGSVESNFIDSGDGNDRILSGAGDDTINGGAGNDTVVVDGARADYTLIARNATTVELSGQNLSYVISKVEWLEFTDVSIDVGQFISENFTNSPPVLAELPTFEFDEDTDIAFQIDPSVASDVNGDVLTFSAKLADGSSLPTWLSFDAENLRFTGTPPANFNGTLNLALSVSDGAEEVSKAFDLVIVSVNDAPTLTSPLEDRAIAAGADFSVEIQTSAFSDPDGDELQLTAHLSDGSALPVWLSFDGTSLSGVAPSDAGDFDIVIVASDGSLQILAPFTLSVESNSDILSGDEGDNILLGSDGSDTIDGSAGNDTIYGGLGDDTLTGGTGADEFVYGTSGGVDHITDFDLSSDVVRINYSGYDSVDSLLPLLQQSGSDAVVYFDENNYLVLDNINVADLTYNHALVGERIFGTDSADTLTGTWDVAEELWGLAGDDVLSGSAKGDTYVYREGDGNDTINDGVGFDNEVDILLLQDLNSTDVSITKDGENLLVSVLSTGEVITVTEQYMPESDYRGIEQITFANGEVWDKVALDAIGSPYGDPNYAIIGTPGSDTLAGSWDLADVIRGMGGDDQLSGSAKGDLYVYRAGDGNDTITDGVGFNNEVDILKLEDLTSSDVTASRNGEKLLISVLSTAEVITVEEQYLTDSDYWGIEQITFADGEIWNKAVLDAIVPL